MTNYYIDSYNRTVTVYLADGDSIELQMNEHSGRVIKRTKLGTLFNVEHTGISIGIDAWGNEWVVHNHISNKKTVLDTRSRFAQMMPVTFHDGACLNNPVDVTRLSLDAVLEGKPYTALFNNCQHVASYACNNTKRSHDLQRVGTTVGLTGLVVAAFGHKNKAVRNIGIFAAILGIGAAIYDANRKD